MFFALTTFFAAFLIEGIGTYVSILGLSALFAYSPIIIIMAIALDIGKIVAVSFLYKNWNNINLVMKSYMLVATIILVLITSIGVFGFLSAQFQKAIVGNTQQTLVINALQEERNRLLQRKEQINNQIATLPERFTANQRIRMIAQFRQEHRAALERIAEIDRELPQLKIQNLEKEVKIGPIIYIAEAFGTTPEQAVKWVILTIIFVFDPLAVALILAGNFLWEQRYKKTKIPQSNNEEQINEIEKKIPHSIDNIIFKNNIEDNKIENQISKSIDNNIPQVDNLSYKHNKFDNIKYTFEPDSFLIPTKDQIKNEENTSNNFDKKNDEKNIITDEKIYPSQLEKIDVRRSDIHHDNELHHKLVISQLKNIYTDKPAVFVGGPPTKY